MSSQVQANTVSVIGGLKLMGNKIPDPSIRRIWWGCGLSEPERDLQCRRQSCPAKASGSIGSFMFGGEVRVCLRGRRWGSDIGFDGFRVGRPMNGAGQAFARVKIGLSSFKRSLLLNDRGPRGAAGVAWRAAPARGDFWTRSGSVALRNSGTKLWQNATPVYPSQPAVLAKTLR